MIDLRNTYRESRQKAVHLMQQGRLSAYIAQLARIQELELQMINYSQTGR